MLKIWIKKWRKGNINDQLLITVEIISTQNTLHPQAKVLLDNEERASIAIEDSVDPPKPGDTESGDNPHPPKKYVHYQLKQIRVRKQYHQKYMHAKIPISQKPLSSTIAVLGSTNSNVPPVITINTKPQIHKWLRKTISTSIFYKGKVYVWYEQN